MSGFNTDGCHKGFVYIDYEVGSFSSIVSPICTLTFYKGIVRISRLPHDVRFGETSWLAQKKILGEEVQALSYHPSMEVYVLGTSRKIDFTLPTDDDFHHEWRSEGTFISNMTILVLLDTELDLEITLRPQIDQGFVRILSPINWTIVNT